MVLLLWRKSANIFHYSNRDHGSFHNYWSRTEKQDADLSYIVKGGRLPSKVKTIANLLRLRPVIGTKNGKLRARGVLYGKARMVEKFATFLTNKIKKEKQYILMIAHANSIDAGEKLNLYMTQKNQNIINSYVLELGGALGAHAGPGALAVGLQEVD